MLALSSSAPAPAVVALSTGEGDARVEKHTLNEFQGVETNCTTMLVICCLRWGCCRLRARATCSCWCHRRSQRQRKLQSGPGRPKLCQEAVHRLLYPPLTVSMVYDMRMEREQRRSNVTCSTHNRFTFRWVTSKRKHGGKLTWMT